MTVLREEKTVKLDVRDFVMNDPLARYLVVQKNWAPVQVGLIAYLWAIGTSIIIAVSSHTFWNGAGFIPFTKDFLYWITESTTVPLVWGYNIWMITSPLAVLTELAQSKVYKPTEKKTEEARKVLNKPWLTPVSLILAFGMGILYFIQFRSSQPVYWFAVNTNLLVVRTLLVIVPTSFVAWTFLFRSIMNVQLFRTTLKNIVVHPFHPDKAGGLRPLGIYALSATYIIAIGGSAVALAEYDAWRQGIISTAYFHHMGVLLYFILGPVSFFTPLSSAHDSMLRAKEEFLLKLSHQFNQEISNASAKLARASDELKENIAKIEQLSRFHTIIDSFPVWPIDWGIFRRFIITMTSPIIPIITAILIDLITH